MFPLFGIRASAVFEPFLWSFEHGLPPYLPICIFSHLIEHSIWEV